MKRHVSPPREIAPGVWQFNEENMMGPYVDAYLVVGEKRALLIDALQTDTGLYEEARKITQKPLEVFITHGHLDHAGAAVRELHEAGVPIYMDLRDFDLLISMTDYGAQRDWFRPLTAGQVFDLGGFVFHTLPIEGHTQGSMAALDYDRQLLFSGDGIGSGIFWMQLPACSPLHVYREALERFLKETEKCPDLKIYPGHRNQSPVQLTGQYVRDNLAVVRGILDGSRIGEPAVLPWNGGELRYRHLGQGQMLDFCYDPENL